MPAYAREVFAVAPTPDALLVLNDAELELVILDFLKALKRDQVRRMTTFEGLISALFQPGAGYSSAAKMPLVEKAVRRAWRALESAGLIEEPDPHNGRNGYRIVTEKGMAVNTAVDHAAAKVRDWLRPELLDPRLHGSCLNAFRNGDYDLAVFEAFKRVEAEVRRKGGYSASDFGAGLMNKAFDPSTGPLRDVPASPSRQRARQKLFEGAMGELRNPKAHAGDPPIADPRLAIEEILAASLLLRIVGQ